MRMSPYRFTVIICVAAWFLIGIHSPLVHEVVDHGLRPHWSVVAVVAAFVLVGCASLWSLLRTDGPWSVRAPHWK